MLRSTILSRLAVNEEGFVFDPRTGDSYTINDTGKVIFRALLNQRQDEEILHELVQSFDVEEEEARLDLRDFLDTLRAYHLL